MAKRQPVDLASHINATVVRGNPADFPVVLRSVSHSEDNRPMPSRRAIVREDTGEAIAVVSDRYTLVPHTRILETVEQAIEPLNVGPVPRGIYVEAKGVRMRAIFKFPALARTVVGQDEICPCLQVRNTYDGSARIALHIGAFRFVCTNLAVGGGGVFAGGFVSIHAGDIPIEKMTGRLVEYLQQFDRVVALYQRWTEERPDGSLLEHVLKASLASRFGEVQERILSSRPATVFDAYNQLTDFATHRMRSARTAFELLDRINQTFQRTWPMVDAKMERGASDERRGVLVPVGAES